MLLVWAVVVLAAAPLALTLTSALSGAGWEAQTLQGPDGRTGVLVATRR